MNHTLEGLQKVAGYVIFSGVRLKYLSMSKRVLGKKIVEEEFGIPIGYEEVVVDIGTGDGKFVYEYARNNQASYVIGIDADKSQLEEVSHKAQRKPARGGLTNLIFLWHAAEEIPSELFGVADQIFINFPWGNLLSGAMFSVPESYHLMQRVISVLKPGGKFNLFVTFDPKFEEQKVSQLSLPELSLEFMQTELTQKYSELGLQVEQVWELSGEEKHNFPSSWPRRILDKRERRVFGLTAAKMRTVMDHSSQR